MSKKSNIAILVLSCDKYSDLWAPFFQTFFKQWPECPYQVFLGANEKKFNHPKVTTVLTGNDKDWSSSLRKILTQIDADHVFIWLEDLFLTAPVDQKQLTNYFEYLIEKQAKHCNFAYHLHPKVTHRNGLGEFKDPIPYRVNVIGFWDKTYLNHLLLDGESPWNFEILGSYRASYDEGFYCFPRTIMPYLNCVEKGKWFPKAVKYCQQENIAIDLVTRQQLEAGFSLKSYLQILITEIGLALPWKFRVNLLSLLRKVFVSY